LSGCHGLGVEARWLPLGGGAGASGCVRHEDSSFPENH
jgi:hypothetical protein